MFPNSRSRVYFFASEVGDYRLSTEEIPLFCTERHMVINNGIKKRSYIVSERALPFCRTLYRGRSCFWDIRHRALPCAKLF